MKNLLAVVTFLGGIAALMATSYLLGKTNHCCCDESDDSDSDDVRDLWEFPVLPYDSYDYDVFCNPRLPKDCRYPGLKCIDKDDFEVALAILTRRCRRVHIDATPDELREELFKYYQIMEGDDEYEKAQYYDLTLGQHLESKYVGSRFRD